MQVIAVAMYVDLENLPKGVAQIDDVDDSQLEIESVEPCSAVLLQAGQW